jgi:N-hydroxyarylamine O-acetyltransferase
VGKKILFKNAVKSITNGVTELAYFEENDLENILESQFDLKIKS